MKKLIILLIWAGSFFILSAQDFSTAVKRIVPNVVDIRSIGMGKTGSAGNTGSNAIFGNPSLLALQQNASIKLGSNFHLAFEKDEYTDINKDPLENEIKYGYKPTYKLSHISAALPFRSNLSSVPFSFAFGAGYHNAIDLSSTSYYKENSITLADFYQYETKESYRGGLNTISPALAFGFFNRISAGISFNIGFGNTKYEYTTITSNIFSGNDTEIKAVIPGKAFSSSIGITGKPLENLTLGANITPPYKWTWKKIEVKKKGGYPEKKYISGGEFSIPLNFSVGSEYQLTENFAVALEYQNRSFESYKLDADSSEEYGGLADLESFFREKNLKNDHVFRAGIEIIAGHVPFRFGFFLEPYPFISTKFSNDQSKVSDRLAKMIGGTFGFSAPVAKSLFLDLAAQYGLLKCTHLIFTSDPTPELKEFDEKEHHIKADLGFRVDLPSFSSNKSGKTNISNPGR